jgi:hypothetical protein
VFMFASKSSLSDFYSLVSCLFRFVLCLVYLGHAPRTRVYYFLFLYILIFSRKKQRVVLKHSCEYFGGI